LIIISLQTFIMDEATIGQKEGFNIFTKLISGFILILILTGIGYFYSYIQMNQLSALISKMHNHPFRVTRAVLSADTNIIKIHRSMKDVALSATDKELEEATVFVNQYEKEVYRHLAIVRKWILGDKGKILLAETTLLFDDWKFIRDEVIAKTRNGRKAQAFSITKGKGARHVEQLNSKMEELKNYAATKASKMLIVSQSMRKKILTLSISIFVVLVTVSGFFGFSFSRNITNNIKEIVKGVKEFGAGNLDHVIKIDSRDEIRWLSNALNQMASQHKKAIAELNLQNEVINNMAEGVFLVSSEDGLIVQANPKLEEMFGYEPREMINKHVAIVNAPTDKNPEETAQEIMQELEDKGFWSGEVNNIRKDGSTFWCSANTSVFDHPSYGNILISVHTDITKRMQLEASLLLHQANLEEQVQERIVDLEKEITGRRNTEISLSESGERFRNLFNTMNSGVAIYNVINDGESGSDYIIQDFNRYALQHEGIEHAEVIGKSLKDLRPTIDQYGLIDTFRKVWKSGNPEFFPATVYVDEKYSNYYENMVFQLPNSEIVAIYDDVTAQKLTELQLKASLKEKETLLHEIHHRVKNNMQVIASLLDLQSNDINDEQVRNALRESQSRVYAMAAVHETLHDSDTLSEIDLNTYLSKIANAVFAMHSINQDRIRLTTNIDELPVSIDQASPLGLIINELMSNSLKYAFPGDRKGDIKVVAAKTGKTLELTVTDNGVGFPQDLDWRKSNSLGLKLVRSLAEEQLGGSVVMKNDRGTRFIIRFKNQT